MFRHHILASSPESEPSSMDSKKLLRVFLAEFLGTLLLVFFGDAAIVQANNEGTIFVHVALGYGLALMIGILVSGGVSGGHLNPAVTLAMVTLRKTGSVEMLVYWTAQYLGAFTGAAMVYGIYADLINVLLKSPLQGGGGFSEIGVAGFFATYPGGFDPSTVTLSFDQILGTALLVVIILAVTDEKNCGVPSGLVPLLIGLGLTAIHLAMAANAGCAINPARDFGPRILTWIVWGSEVWSAPNDDYFFWIPWILPHVGAVVGAFCYQGMIAIHHDKEDSQQQRRREVQD